MSNRRIIVLLVLWSIAYAYFHQPSEQLFLITCDVGQGDAILVQKGSWQLLVDAGRDDKVLACLDQYMPFLDTTLEVVVATHPDADHIGGLPIVISSYDVKSIITNGQTKETDDFRQLEAVVQRKVNSGAQLLRGRNGLKLSTPESNQLFEIKSLFPLVEERITRSGFHANTEALLSDVEDEKTLQTINYNDGSIVLLVRYGAVRILLTGDLEAKGERALLENKLITDVDVLKVGHHGAKTSSTIEFLEVTRPEISLISAGTNNTYGHPSPQVLTNLENIGSRILRTDLEKNIVLVTDGVRIWKPAVIFNLAKLKDWFKFKRQFL